MNGRRAFQTPSVYSRLGVEAVINAAGHYTEVGGSCMPDEVMEAMAEARRCYVDMHALHARAGEHLARLVGVPAAHVTAGAAAGVTLAAAACMTGPDLARIRRLPDTRGMKDEIVVQKSQTNPYDRMLRVAGARIVEAGRAWPTTPEDLREAVTDRTAAIEYVISFLLPDSGLDLDTVIAVARRRGCR